MRRQIIVVLLIVLSPPCLLSSTPKKWTRPKSQNFVASYLKLFQVDELMKEYLETG